MNISCGAKQMPCILQTNLIFIAMGVLALLKVGGLCTYFIVLYT